MDPLALLGLREDRAVEIAGEIYTLRGDLTFKDWVRAMYEPLPLLAVLPFSEAQALNRRSYDNHDPGDVGDFDEGWHTALTTATGLDWWVAERLVVVLVQDWSEIAGRLSLKGIDALTSPPDLVLHTLLAMALDGMDDKARRKFQADLYKPPMPPPGAAKTAKTPPPGFSEAEQGAAFLAAHRARTAGVRAG